MHFFTSVTSNYIPKARVLAKSVKRHCPDSVFYLVLCDDLPEAFHLEEEPFDHVLQIKDLGLPVENLEQWVFMHTVVELCTAVKGQAFIKIFESDGADKIVYLDPDIVVFDDLQELSHLLDTYSVVLTPHQVEPEKDADAVRDNEICSLMHGVFNLGFLAVRRSSEGIRFVKWWRERLIDHCYDNIPNGLFTDQKWVDLAPAFFDDLYILRDKSYNVATWNLTHRTVTEGADGKYYVDGKPLQFYHFSGFDSGAQELMLTKYAKDNPVLFKLRDWYIAEQEKEGQSILGKKLSVYEFFSNGEKITKDQRIVYRSRLDVMNAFPDPFKVNDQTKICYYWWYKSEIEQKSDAIEADKNNQVVQALQKELDHLRKQLEELKRSKSWRLTKPLRELKNILTR
jgi:lipopolysaccharide biosynthesis glycosyltransferase